MSCYSHNVVSMLVILLVSIVNGEATHLREEGKDKGLATIFRRDDCRTNPNWQATRSAWLADNTDTVLSSWWHDDILPVSHQSFAHELGERFGAHLNGFQCGIGAYSTCIAPACADYQNNGDPAWSYLSILAVVNLNTYFNALYVGISNGQADYHALTNDIAAVFFPWKDPQFIFGDAAFWVVATLTALFAIPAAVEGVAVEVAAVAVGIGAFAAAGVQQVSQSLAPDALSSQLTQSEGLAKLDVFAEQVGSATRQGVEVWANTTMNGEPDSLNKTILDYLHDGGFATQQSIPTYADVEKFYKAQMVSRTIDTQWKTQKIFLTFHKTDDPEDTSGPNQTRYYSAEDGGVYYLYRYSEDGVLRGHLDKPWGLDYLNGTTYGISGLDITKASARAFRVGGFNYSQTLAQDRLTGALTNNSLTPFQDGAGWEGTWTLPVCDTGTNNWNTQYGNKSNRYGMLPCCCGPNCTDTATFAKAANLYGFQTLLRGCKAQLSSSDVKYDDVDFGFKWKNSFPLTWATWSTAKKAGVGIGIVMGYIVLVGLMGLCCCG